MVARRMSTAPPMLSPISTIFTPGCCARQQAHHLGAHRRPCASPPGQRPRPAVAAKTALIRRIQRHARRGEGRRRDLPSVAAVVEPMQCEDHSLRRTARHPGAIGKANAVRHVNPPESRRGRSTGGPGGIAMLTHRLSDRAASPRPSTARRLDGKEVEVERTEATVITECPVCVLPLHKKHYVRRPPVRPLL